MLLLAGLGICLVAFGALVLIRFPNRPGGKIRFLGLEVDSRGAGMPLIALGALLVVVAATQDGDDGATSDGGDGTDKGVFSVGTEVGDLDARGDKVVFTAAAPGGSGAVINRLDLGGGGSERVSRAPLRYDGIDVGIDRLGRARLVYSRCDGPECASSTRVPSPGRRRPFSQARRPARAGARTRGRRRGKGSCSSTAVARTVRRSVCG